MPDRMSPNVGGGAAAAPSFAGAIRPGPDERGARISLHPESPIRRIGAFAAAESGRC